jgi:hypothetical protein
MREQAHPQTINGEHVFVYEGYTTRLFQQLQLPGPYYSSVLQRLQSMGCIRQLSRGGGSAASRWALLDDPTIEAFYVVDDEEKQPTRLDLIEQRLDALEQAAEG